MPEIEDIDQGTMDTLTGAYARKLPERIAQFEQSWTELLQNPSDGTPLKTMYRLVHNLIGSSSIFGFMEVSYAAQPLETALKKVMDADTPPHEEQLGQIRTFLDGLAQAVKNAQDVNRAD